MGVFGIWGYNHLKKQGNEFLKLDLKLDYTEKERGQVYI